MRTILFILLLLLSSCLGVQGPMSMSGGGEVSAPSSEMVVTVIPDQPDSSVATVRQEVTVESADVSGYAGNLLLHVTGTAPDGCTFPVNADISVDGNTIIVNVFRIVPQENACPLIVTPFSATFTLPETIKPGPVVIHVNGTMIKTLVPSIDGPVQIDPPEPPTLDMSDGIVHSVPIITDVQIMVLESYPMRLSVTVTGDFRDGCDLPIQIEQMRDGDSVRVKLFHVIEPDTACQAGPQPFTYSFMLDGGFESGTYTIHINDVTKVIEL